MNQHRNYAIFGGLGLLLTAAGFARVEGRRTGAWLDAVLALKP